jgi:hypothetical protein
METDRDYLVCWTAPVPTRRSCSVPIQFVVKFCAAKVTTTQLAQDVHRKKRRRERIA